MEVGSPTYRRARDFEIPGAFRIIPLFKIKNALGIESREPSPWAPNVDLPTEYMPLAEWIRASEIPRFPIDRLRIFARIFRLQLTTVANALGMY